MENENVSEFDDLGSIYMNPILYHNKNIKSYIFMQLSNKEVWAMQVSWIEATNIWAYILYRENNSVPEALF